jgi:hypothetical protein
MQVPVYIATSDYEILGKNLPKDFKTVPQYVADIIRQKAETFRSKVIVA